MLEDGGGYPLRLSATKTPTGVDVGTGSNIWIDSVAGFVSRTDEAASSGSVADIGSGSISTVGSTKG